jgi:hypothetical protein
MRSNSKELIAAGQRKESVTISSVKGKFIEKLPMAPPYLIRAIHINCWIVEVEWYP